MAFGENCSTLHDLLFPCYLSLLRRLCLVRLAKAERLVDGPGMGNPLMDLQSKTMPLVVLQLEGETKSEQEEKAKREKGSPHAGHTLYSESVFNCRR